MKKIVKTLSHGDRVYGRIISGGSQISLKREVGKMLVDEIKSGFFEKWAVDGIRVTRPLCLPFAVLYTFRKTQPN